MKDPMNKRILRELKDDFGKYLVIFLFMILVISFVSAFLVADNSVYYAYEEGFEKYNLEWGHFAVSTALDEATIQQLEAESDTTIYDLSYFEEKDEEKGANIRVYQVRSQVNLACVMEGSLPTKENEIALDRMFAQNNAFQVGDTITLRGKVLTITGLIAVPDYSCLFESNTDMMFDAVNFSIAVMTEAGYQAVESSKQFYNYAWMYTDAPADDTKEKEASDAFLETVKTTLAACENPVVLTDYLPRYNNQAINFTGEDMGGDKAMFIVFDYIVIVILAFVFAVTISGTITREAGVIGTLRASGYKKSELIRHYMVLPVLVTLIAAVIGNIIGYTWLKSYMVGIYYSSYSLCTYETLWNGEAFLDTTVIPVVLMFGINLLVLVRKMQFSPLDFLRRDLKRKKKKKALRLNTKIPFLHRFRIRILLQNIPNYITLFFGIQLAAIIVVFGQMFTPLLDDYAAKIEDSMIATYQYVLKTPVETENTQAEKYSLTSLETTDDRFMTDEISVYGIIEDSAYITKQIETGKVFVSTGILEKFGLQAGDTLTLKAPYADTTYTFVIQEGYDYDAGLAVFMCQSDYKDTFDEAEEAFTGYFSNAVLTDIDKDLVAATITQEELTKLSRQMKVSMGDFMKLFQYFGAIMFTLLMYLLSKQIIEKNAQSISMAKILGFRNLEIGGLYIVATSIVVLLSLLIAVPITDGILRLIFKTYLYGEITGYIPYIVSPKCYVIMIGLGILCYGAVSILQLFKIRRIPKSDALKNVE